MLMSVCFYAHVNFELKIFSKYIHNESQIVHKNITYLMVEIVCDLDIRVKSYGEKTKRKRWVCMHASIGRCGDWRLAGWVGPGSKLGWPGLPIVKASVVYKVQPILRLGPTLI